MVKWNLFPSGFKKNLLTHAKLTVLYSSEKEVENYHGFPKTIYSDSKNCDTDDLQGSLKEAFGAMDTTGDILDGGKNSKASNTNTETKKEEKNQNSTSRN